MSHQHRPKPTAVTVCDLCDEEIDKGEPGESGYLIGSGPTRGTREPKWFRFFWPSGARERKRSGRDIYHSGGKKGAYWDPQFTTRQYDFHAECILRLVEHAVALREAGETS